MSLLVSVLHAARRIGNCRCGHAHDTHRHYRPGQDCGGCACLAYTWSVGRARARSVSPAAARTPYPERAPLTPPAQRLPGNTEDIAPDQRQVVLGAHGVR